MDSGLNRQPVQLLECWCDVVGEGGFSDDLSC